MSMEKLLAQKAEIERRIEEQKAIEKSFEKAKKIVLDILDANPRIAIADRVILKDKITAAVREVVAGI